MLCNFKIAHNNNIVSKHERTRLMYTKYAYSYLLYYIVCLLHFENLCTAHEMLHKLNKFYSDYLYASNSYVVKVYASIFLMPGDNLAFNTFDR